jgi:PilZ domain
MEERRAQPRFRVLKAGKIEFGRSVIDCTVRNMSPIGAGLEVASPLGIPTEFTLHIAGETTGRAVRVVWRQEKRIGVEFIA